MPRPKPPTKSTAARRRNPGGPSTRPGGVPLKRDHIEQARSDVERGLKDTERRGIPSNVPKR
jgi:hypothetical protein